MKEIAPTASLQLKELSKSIILDPVRKRFDANYEKKKKNVFI